jgi:hypothetical protein
MDPAADSPTPGGRTYDDAANGPSDENGNNNIPQPPPPQEPTGAFSVKFKDQSGYEVVFKLKRTTKLGKAMDAYSAKAERARDQLRFLFEGVRIMPDDTAEKVSCSAARGLV